MYHITLSKEIKQNCPEFRGAAVFAEVTNTPYCEGLWQEIATFTQELRARETTDSIKYQPVIAATREAYKRCGKDPSRYRPSAEALRRRLLRGLELYQIDTLVDLINLVSLRTGHSIGGFDADEIQGTDLELGIGCLLYTSHRTGVPDTLNRRLHRRQILGHPPFRLLGSHDDGSRPVPDVCQRLDAGGA